VLFQLPDYGLTGGRFQVYALVFLKNLIGCIESLGFLEKIIQWILRYLVLQNIHGKKIGLATPGKKLALHIDLDEEHLGDFIKCSCRVFLFTVSNDVVAFMEKIGKFLLLEGAQS